MWYREGTITFTQGSNTLVGAGTAWNVTANGVLPGMIVIGPDNKLYEIKRVTSDTNIVLSEPYTGETQSEVPCRIITTYEGDLTQFSARFTALMSRMSADSKSMRSWLTALDEVTIEREDGTEVTVKPLMQIVNEHNENVEWYKNNTDAIDAAGDKAREAAASAAAAAESANTAGEKASQASQSASAAASSQSAASASATAAKKSETNAAASQQSAATSASTATTKASEAATSARDAAASKEAAKSSETNASLSASSAASSATAAGNSAKAAKTSETNARSSETAAGQSASAAAGSKTAAASSASAASTSAGQASASATAAGKSAESAASSASTATTKAGEATEQASAAARSASAAKTSETNAKASETRAESSKTAAASSASSAASSASSASASKDEATRQASAAKGSATTASTKATEAAGSATAASQSKTAAESAATRAEAAADRAEEIAGAVAMEDASLTTKGVVKLSSAVDSTSESLAATPKAVKAANDNANSRVPSNRKVNGKALTADITLTPKDIGTLNSVTMSFSGGAGWFKLATVTMPQASSIVYIALIGGAGYNVGSPHQAGISELVLRAGNGNPKGITGALWKRTAVGLTNFAWINTSGDTYDIYVEIGNYATSVNIHWDCTANASVSIYTSPTYSASKPSSVTDGVVYTMYSTHQKPTPLDIGALPTTGGTVSGPLSVTGGITGTLNGNASTATKLQTARSIGGVGFDGSANINLPGVNTTGNQNTTGNAATATKLQTARTIGGVSFDGTANINLPGVNTAGNQNTTGNAATATKLQTARNINGVKFDGSGDININTLVSRGRVTALSGSTQGTAGIQMYEAYNNGYPTTYGNILHMKGAGAIGEGEMLVGWSGTHGAHAPVYVRSRRDTPTANWSGWAQVYTTAHKPTAADVGALPSGGGTLSGALTLSMVAPSVQLRGQGTDTRQYIMAYRTDGATSWYVGKANNGSDSAMLWNYTGANGVELAADGNVRINAKGKQFTFANNGNLGLVASLDQSSVPQGTYHQVAMNSGTSGAKSYLRKFRGGNADTVWHETVQDGNYRLATGDTDSQGEMYLSTSGWVRFRGEVVSESANGLRAAFGNFGFFIRNDGTNTYFLLTASGDKYGSWNGLRPLTINNVSGAVSMSNGLTVAGGLNVTSGNLKISTSSTSWIDMRAGVALSNSSAVSTSSASAIVRQEHADRHFILGGLGNSQFGIYMINKSRTANGTDAAAYLQNDGTWVCAGNGSFNDVYIRSDRRSKRNIRKIERALDKLEQIEGVLYEIQVCGRYEQSGGLIAQDVQNVQPELVTVDHNDQSGEPRLRLNYNGVIGMLVEAVKELREEVRELKAKM
ncbi:TPA: tail fiber domain-containing protein [Escherichia coli]|nr:tail fiber domain-containing protein [Escherichia coli]HCW2895186.1 tail fiber domain-containing protein [Escherichia coli]HCW3033071.1 tail fiber domain-containing protein [Escherichia coli]HDL0285378.1 tail fiber domain-containing protein [Escherichia coli]HDL0315534.1 tail fiber domain-containing protein [Escherichia coli]